MWSNFLNNLWADNRKFIEQHGLANFHVRGVHSLLLQKTDTLTLRLYLFRPGEHELGRLWDNALLVHNHSFYFESLTLAGALYNVPWRPWDEETDDLENTIPFFQYRYSSALKGEPQLTEETPVRLYALGAQVYRRGQSYTMQPEELHRIGVEQDRYTAVLFWEHAADPRVIPHVYSRDPLVGNPCAHPDLYRKLSPIEVSALMDECLSQVKR